MVTINEAPIAGKDNPYTPAVDPLPGTGGDHTFGLIADEAYVSVGAANIWMIGKKGTIINKGDDEPLNFLGLFNSEKVDKGVFWNGAYGAIDDGGVVIQTTMDLGNGLFASAGLERLDASGPVRLLSRAAPSALWSTRVTASPPTCRVWPPASSMATSTSSPFTLVHRHVRRLHRSCSDRGRHQRLLQCPGHRDGLARHVQIAVSGEAVSGPGFGGTDYGVGGSIGATVADGVDINLGGRFYSDANGPDAYQVAARSRRRSPRPSSSLPSLACTATTQASRRPTAPRSRLRSGRWFHRFGQGRSLLQRRLQGHRQGRQDLLIQPGSTILGKARRKPGLFFCGAVFDEGGCSGTGG